MSTKSATLDHEAGYTTEEIERYHDQQDRSARRRRWLLGTGVAVVVAGGAAAAALMYVVRQHPGRPGRPGRHVHLDRQPGRAEPPHYPDR
jgi:hypothetical protein